MGEKTTIQIRDETWKQLDARKQRGETFDDVIQDLMTTEVQEFEGDEPEVVDHDDVSGEQCAHFIPDRGPCEKSADHILTIEYNGNESEVPYCDEHANLSNGGGQDE